MPPPDANPELGHHPDVAGWVLSALDRDDALAFMQHLQSCEECRSAVDDLRPVARAVTRAAPALEPPADLGARTIAAVQQAALADRRPAETPTKATRRWHWHWHWHWHWGVRLVSLASALAGAAVALAAVVVVPLLQTAPAITAAAAVHIPLHSTSGDKAVYGLATARQTPGGSWHVTLSVHGLKNLGPDRVYGCWYTSPGSHRWVNAGSFVMEHSGSETFPMTSGADPHQFNTMKIIAEHLGDPGPSGKVILSGTTQPT